MKKIKNAISYFISGFKEGDSITKLSYLVMGAGSFMRKQYVRGFTLLGIQIVSFAYLIMSGFSRIAGLANLGTVSQGKTFDEALGIYIYSQGDNSMLFLLFGVLAIFAIVGTIGVYALNIVNAVENQKIVDSGRELPTFKEDIQTLLDEKFHITVLTIPTILTFIFTLLPLVFMILIAFTNFDKTHQPPGNLFTWVGLKNFKDMFYNNSIISGTFFALLKWTFIWAFFATFLNYILGMLLAMLINSKGIKIKKFWRTVFVITIAVPQFVSLLLMSQLLADNGSLNVLLKNWGLVDSSIKFLTDGNLAKITVIVINCWVGIPYTMLITSGILMNIPADLYESAEIDGAGPWVKFRKITLPYMLHVTTPYLITQFVGNLNNFNVIFLLTGGGPLSLEYHQAGKTDLLVTWLYKLTVEQKDYALASTLGIIIFVISATLSLIVFKRTTQQGQEGEFN
ncbi:sugar ABC transporter permease [Erysipelothrix sp. HDW6A]|uniref:carbohydrate ABC transporter permease n=1 Tax=Erysipelothrix sp. HDW6A TaxID=2714928 RepID=UPI0014080A8E|nr:sugar ABC transporter permease [Erysipelothrix sp. HDW6A]QIK56830.1 sugar ABC transporter permease [Erysipelothrix sp. HDW6A]